MNNRLYMRASAVMHDPVFKDMVKGIKQNLGPLPEIELWFNRYLIALANSSIALNTKAPDFSLFEKELDEHTWGKGAPECGKGYLSGVIDGTWLVLQKFFSVEEYGFYPWGLWEWVRKCITDDQCPKPEVNKHLVFTDFDIYDIKLQAEVFFLKEILKDHEINLEEALKNKGFDQKLNRIHKILNVEPKILVEIPSGKAFLQTMKENKLQVDILTDAFKDMDKKMFGKNKKNPFYGTIKSTWLANKLASHFENKLNDLLVPLLFESEDIEKLLTKNDKYNNKEEGNVEKVIEEMFRKTGYRE